jgi:hypothetical protein
MSARISRISLVVFGVLLVLSTTLLTVPGGYWPWHSLMAIVAIVPIVAGPNRFRILGAVALLLSLFCIFADIESGKHHRQKMQQIRDRRTSTNAPRILLPTIAPHSNRLGAVVTGHTLTFLNCRASALAAVPDLSRSPA